MMDGPEVSSFDGSFDATYLTELPEMLTINEGKPEITEEASCTILYSHCSLSLTFKVQVGDRWDAGEVSQSEERAESRDSWFVIHLYLNTSTLGMEPHSLLANRILISGDD